MTANKRTGRVNAALEYFGSIRLALLLLCVIIIISFAGAVAPEDIQPGIFYSWWFLGVLAVFAVNTAACLALRVTRKGPGSRITHASILVILAGSLLSFLAGQKGTLELTKGEGRDSFVSGDRSVPLGFTVTLKDFNVEWYRPQYFKLGVIVEDKGLRKKFDAVPGREYSVPGTRYAFVVTGYYPDFAMDEEGRPVNLSERATNPALSVRVSTPSGIEDRWVFSRHPDLSMGQDSNIRFRFLQEPMIKEFRSTLDFAGPKGTAQRYAKVNSPVAFGGFTFYQSGYDPQKPEWTALEVVRDPGAPVVFTGFALLNIGIIMVYAGRWAASRGRK
ncbi:MAG: cytochrome c biogenesis protein ResB [Deltaproteobacteria bacterium]